MNSRRSYLETLNAGRQRRAHSSIEQLNRSLETLEQRIGRAPDRPAERPEIADRGPLPPIDVDRWPASRHDMPLDARRPAPRLGEGETSYRTLARDFERVRGQEDSVAAVGRIAGELKGLREELRQQMTSGLKREFDALRKDIERAYSAPASAVNGAELSAEFDRLSDAIQSLSEKTDDKSLKLLRLELEQVRGAIDSLAREETVLSVDRRWDEFDRRFTKFEDRFDAQARDRVTDPAIQALTQRLEEINQAVNNLPESLSLRSLEEKVRTLAGAVDHFARQQDNRRDAPFDLIEERLDEISRAIVASAATAAAPQFDPEPFERVEARISSLASQIEELVEDRPSVEVIDRLNLLSQRVDEIAASGQLPDQAIERLARQVAVIADKLDHAPVPDADHIFNGIEQRFDMLSALFDRKQGDAIEYGQAVFRDLERRLDDLATRLDERADRSIDSSGIMNAIDARFEELARRLEPPAAASDIAISHLEARLEDISARLENSSAPVAAVDPGIVRNLEAQVAELSRHLAGPSAALREFEDIGPRLDDIEKSLVGTRETILETARQAAENAVHSFSGSKTQAAAVGALAEDLKSLEDLARRSDERNTKTFEAIHDTLLKIVERLGSLEDGPISAAVSTAPSHRMALRDAPAIEPTDEMQLAGDLPTRSLGGEARDVMPKRSPAEAAAEAAVAALGTDPNVEPSSRVRAMLGGISRAFAGKKEPEPAKSEPSLPGMEEEAPKVDLDQPLDPKIANRPLEPGSGAPDLNAIMRRVRDERSQPRNGEGDAAKSDFIAAARRAAQAAAAEAEVMKRHPDLAGPVRNMKVGDLFRSKLKPILIAAAAILIALAGLQLGKAFFKDAQIAAAEPEQQPIVEQAEPDATATAATAPSGEAPPARMADAPDTDAPQDITPAQQDPVAADVAGPETVTGPETAMESATPAPEEKNAEPTAAMPEQTNEAPATAEAAPPMDAAAKPADSTSQPAATPTVAVEPVPVDAGPLPLREAAETGDPKAMFEIGSRYAEGRGTKSDMKIAAKWYEKSADLGLAPAQYRIGNFHEKGIGVDRDIAKAKTWYQMAAEQGNASAMHNLAVLYAMGADGTADNDSAARWFEKAAELGVKDSQFNLGILSAKGVGMPQNLEESYKWFALVAKTGDRDAAAKRDEIANALRPEQLERARAAAELWKAKPVNAETNTVSIPEAWRESDAKTASVDMKKAIRNIQSILNKNGYDAGSADGVMGQKTKLAIAAFQKDNGMDATGEIDEKLVRKLLEKK
jgi:localization factor PodJL